MVYAMLTVNPFLDLQRIPLPARHYHILGLGLGLCLGLARLETSLTSWVQQLENVQIRDLKMDHNIICSTSRRGYSLTRRH